MDDIDLDALANIADDPLRGDRNDPEARRRRSKELVQLAVGLVAFDRATIPEAARLAGTSRQRLHEALRRHRSRIEEPRAAYLTRLWPRLVARHDRELARERALEQAELDAIDEEVDAAVPAGPTD